MDNQFDVSTIKAIALDVDGVLTDGTFWWGNNGEVMKRFCYADVMGIGTAIRAGYKFVLISGEDSPLVERYAKKMGIPHFYKHCHNKAGALREYAAQQGLELEQICFMGDDLNDLEAMSIAGLSIAPASAVEAVRRQVKMVTKQAGGQGAVREVTDWLLASMNITPIVTPQAVSVEHK